MTSTGDLDGKVAIVTGGAGGIGSATAVALAGAGARVLVADLVTAPIDEVVETITGAGHEAVGCAVDLADEDSIAALVAAAVDAFGGVDIVDNNAAATHLAPQDVDIARLPVEVWDRAMAVNVRGPMLVIKHVLPVLLERGGGSIVNISSGLSLTGELATPAYGASKAALNQLTRHVATTYGGGGVRCNAIAVGLVESPMMLSQMPPPVLDLFRENCLVPRLGRPDDIAEMVVFLASRRSAYVTGQVVAVDGGFLAHSPTVAPVRQLMTRWAPPPDPAGLIS